ncbi:MAG: Uma2 family endonuclease [Chloroflexota bacterium]
MALSEVALAGGRAATLLRDAVDDTDEAPWMTMPEFQYFMARLLVGILQQHARRQGLGWHVTGELGVRMPKPEGQGTLTLGPDLFVVEADEGWRTTWDISAEGQPPRFVLEVVTQDSVERDTEPNQKVGYYAAMGVEEYAIYWPYRAAGGPKLFGYRRDTEGAWIDWATDAQGVLWSGALGGLGLVIREASLLRVVNRQGELLPSPEEEADAYRLADIRAEQEAAERRLADARAEQEAERATREAARAEREAARAATAEAELASMRALLESREG